MLYTCAETWLISLLFLLDFPLVLPPAKSILSWPILHKKCKHPNMYANFGDLVAWGWLQLKMAWKVLLQACCCVEAGRGCRDMHVVQVNEQNAAAQCTYHHEAAAEGREKPEENKCVFVRHRVHRCYNRQQNWINPVFFFPWETQLKHHRLQCLIEVNKQPPDKCVK